MREDQPVRTVEYNEHQEECLPWPQSSLKSGLPNMVPGAAGHAPSGRDREPRAGLWWQPHLGLNTVFNLLPQFPPLCTVESIRGTSGVLLMVMV